MQSAPHSRLHLWISVTHYLHILQPWNPSRQDCVLFKSFTKTTMPAAGQRCLNKLTYIQKAQHCGEAQSPWIRKSFNRAKKIWLCWRKLSSVSMLHLASQSCPEFDLHRPHLKKKNRNGKDKQTGGASSVHVGREWWRKSAIQHSTLMRTATSSLLALKSS